MPLLEPHYYSQLLVKEKKWECKKLERGEHRTDRISGCIVVLCEVLVLLLGSVKDLFLERWF